MNHQPQRRVPFIRTSQFKVSKRYSEAKCKASSYSRGFGQCPFILGVRRYEDFAEDKKIRTCQTEWIRVRALKGGDTSLRNK